jgi:hypothetical protein
LKEIPIFIQDLISDLHPEEEFREKIEPNACKTANFGSEILTVIDMALISAVFST